MTEQGIVKVQETVAGYRLIPSKYPPIALFDDVATPDEFDLLYEIQALTNPRLQSELGNLNLLPRTEWPWGIPGCSYAVAPFTHVNPDGSRFSSGDFGMFYLGESKQTAIREVMYHQQRYWTKIPSLKYDRLVFRCLACHLAPSEFVSLSDTVVFPDTHPYYAPDDYSASRLLGTELRQAGEIGVRYRSVRNPCGTCWGLFTPRLITDIHQANHVEMVWNGSISSVNTITAQ